MNYQIKLIANYDYVEIQEFYKFLYLDTSTYNFTLDLCKISSKTNMQLQTGLIANHHYLKTFLDSL
jgi:hypothetical protein